MKLWNLGTFSLLFFLAVFCTGPRPASAAQLTVTITADTNDGVCDANCSLREAMTLAVSGDEIIFASPLFDTAQTISLGIPLPAINNSITITGKGADILKVQRSGGPSFTIFTINSSANATIKGLTITGGVAPTTTTAGGVQNFGILSLQNCAVSGNSATNGGGLITAGAAAVTNITGCTISGNSTVANGGGIFGATSSTTNLTNSTVSGNTAGFGGVVNNGATMTIIACTISANTAPGIFASGSTSIKDSVVASNSSGDVSGGFTSGGFNLIANATGSTGFTNGVNNDKVGVSALLGPLANNGGHTLTHALLAGSPALDAGNAFGLTTDERGMPRPFDIPGLTNVADGSDMGALERQDGPTAAGVSVGGRVSIAGGLGRGLFGATVTLTDAEGNRRTAITNPFGYYSFADVNAGEVCVISVEAKGYQVTPQVLQVNSDLSGVDFIASP